MKKILIVLSIFLYIYLAFFLTINDGKKIEYSSTISDSNVYARPNVSYLGNSVDPNFKKAFFYNMNENIGYNVNGSCTYIALEMILKYYDLYINDNIIDEKYDVTYDISCNQVYDDGYKSDIVVSLNSNILSEQTRFNIYRQEYIEEYGYFDEDSYLDFINENNNDFFHLYLLDIGYSKMFYDGDFGMNYEQLDKLVSTYFLSKGLEYKKNYCAPGNNIVNFVKNNIDNGIPVVLGITSDEGRAHSVVAYDYVGDTIYFNDGYGNNTHATLEDIGYDNYNEAYSFEIVENHVCNDDCNVINVDYDCICDVDGKHPSHSHRFTYSYLPSGELHYAACICGLMISTQSDYHTINGFDTFIINGKDYAYCVICNGLVCLENLSRYYIEY